jgi:hypothetical protein
MLLVPAYNSVLFYEKNFGGERVAGGGVEKT